MELRKILNKRLTKEDLYKMICLMQGGCGDPHKKLLYKLINDTEERISYNALWIFTHFSATDNKWLYKKKNDLINKAMITPHKGKLRLLLTLLQKQPITRNDLRTDYLNFCLTKINSTEPYAIRSLCIKQAYAQCRFYPELLTEFKNQIDIMKDNKMSPGMRATLKNIINQLSQS
ncbi:hypothetical protein [Phocaeicola sartorii]|uniref:hypothetical protein n=1 Tax=Phocaeicola sartorii TaxID=671267 RepID=UPI00258A71D1|nr:hypothetical protein [Phocaeicola sartorii]